MSETPNPAVVHVVSHGPHCLDGVASAVAVARFYEGSDVRPLFSGNPKIDEVLRSVEPISPERGEELWITDISWTRPETDAHLRSLAERGVRIFWIDHHKTAIERVRNGGVNVPFAGSIVDDRYSAARLVFEHLRERLEREGRRNERFDAFERVVLMADDNDRWVHEIDGSWDLALTIRSIDGAEAFDELYRIDADATYSPRMDAARRRVEAELAESLERAQKSRTERRLPSGVTVVAAVVSGYPSEIGDRWGHETPNAVFAFFDLRSAGVSFRRSPDCRVDLSKVAQAFGGGGHPAAAGCEMADLLAGVAAGAADRVAETVSRIG